MDKITFIEGFIEKCDSTTSDHDNLIDEIIYTFSNDIDNLSQGLASYGYGGSPNSDLQKLKSVLSNYKHDIQREDKLRNDKLKELELQRQIISITNTNHNESTSISKANATTSVNITQTMKNINELPEGILDKEETVELKELLHSIEEMIAEKDKEGVKSKITKVLSTVGNKGFELFVAVAPYLFQAATGTHGTT